MFFTAIQGYASIKRYLIHAAQTGRVPHAQLFWGPEGSASLPLALAFVAYLNCHHRHKDDACGQCNSCIKVKKIVHPDVKFVFPTSNTQHVKSKDVVSVSFLKAWRSFLHASPHGNASDWSFYLNRESKQLSIPREEARDITQSMSLKAFEGKYKVVLVWLPEYLHIATANALLKIIEEPPSNTVFLLVSTHPDAVLSTIRSRTRPLYIPAFTDQALATMLTQQYSLSQEQLTQILLLAEGNFNKACRFVENMQGGYFDHFKKWMRLCYTHNLTQLLDQAGIFQAMSKTDQKSFFTYALHMLRESLISCYTHTQLTRVSTEERAFAKKLKQNLTSEQIKVWIAWFNQAYYHTERYLNPRMLYLDLSLKLADTFRKQPQ